MLTVISGNNRNGHPCALNKVGDIFQRGIPPFQTEGLTDFKSGNSQDASQKGGFPLAGLRGQMLGSVKVTASEESKTYAGVTVSMTSGNSTGYVNLSSPELGSAKYRQNRSSMQGVCPDNLLNRKAESAFVQAAGKEKGPAVSQALLSTSVISCTGKKAAAFKEAYIAEFNRMEAELYSIPKYKPQAAELFNDDDTRCLTHLVWSMANGFHFDRAWTQAIWYALRRVTGVPSPQHFEIRQLPLLAEECRRIYAITNQLKEAIFDAEKQTMRRILRHREDEAIVLAEMQRMLEESTQQHYGVMTHALEKWQQANVSQFLQRH